MKQRSDTETGFVTAPAVASFGRSLRMVAWSFLGIRKSSEYQQDLAQVSPLHVIVVAIGAVAIFVVSLIGFVNWVATK
jgi:hypothetical protein